MIFSLIQFFDENLLKANIIDPDGTPCYVVSHLGLNCLPIWTRGLNDLMDTHVVVLLYREPVSRFST